ncbi:autotransporter outer membrane beta-barrel domain-containing protein [Sinorhizobium meliloti]|nr:autotransporter outer membrane beta-barrel domain-containing protein [Sinorhizobium meliloti]
MRHITSDHSKAPPREVPRTRLRDLSRLLRGGRMTKWKGEVASYAPNLAQFVSAAATLRTALLPAALLTGLAAGPALAADRYWDVNQTSTGSGGAGVWNLSNLYWSPSSSDTLGPYNAPWDNGALDHALFAGTAGTVTLGAPITANALTFNTNAYTISGTAANILTLAGTTPTVTVTTGTSTISAVVAGSAGLTKAGAGGLILTGTNTFTGAVVVNAGVLSVGSDAALGNAANTVTLSGGTTFSAGGDLSGRTVTLAGNVTFGAQAGSARITGTGNVSVASGGVMSNDNSDYVGNTTFGSHALWASRSFTSVRNTGEASSLGSSGDIIMASQQQGAEVVTYTGDGDTSNRTFRLNAINHVMSFVNGGTGTLALTGSIVLEGNSQSSFSANGGDFALTGTISAIGNGGIGLGGSAGRTVTLSGNNSYAGSTDMATVTVVAPTLANIGTNSSFGTGNSDSEISVNNGALSYTGSVAASNRTWLFSNNASLRNDGSGGLTLTGAAQFNAGAGLDTLTLGGSFAGENTLSGALTGSGSVVMNGAGTWVLNGANTYTGSTTVQNGTLRAGSATAFGAVNAATVTGGVLDLAAFDNTFTRLDGTGGQVQLGGADLTLNIANGITATYAGEIAGAGDLIKIGAGRQVLSGVSTYTGATSINGGTLELSYAGAGGPTGSLIANSSSLNMNGGTLLMTGGSGEANTQTFAATNITGGSNVIGATAGTSGGSATLNLGAINRTAGLVNFNLPTNGGIFTSNTALGGWATVNGSDYAKVDVGRIVAFTADDYTEVDEAANWQDNQYITDADGDGLSFFGTVSGSKQLAGLRYATAATSTVTVSTGQVLGVDGTIIVASSVGATNKRIQGGFLRGSAGGVLGIQQNSAGTYFIDSTIVDNAGATGLTVSGSGTGKVSIGGTANTYSGVTWVAAQGTLEVSKMADGGVASSIGMSSSASSNLVIEGGTISYAGTGDTSNRAFTLMRSGAITGGTINVSQTAANLTLGGEVVSPDGAGLTKTGTGTLTLTNANNSYTGVTKIDAGALAVSHLADGGTNSSIGASSSASANLVLNGGELAYIGDTDASNRGFTLQSASGISVSDPGTTLTLAGTATGAGPLSKNGAGTLVLAGMNNFTGNVTVNDGVLRAGSTQAFGTGIMTVNSATLELAGFSNSVAGLAGTGDVALGSGTLTITHGGNSSFSGVISGSGGLTKSGGGIQTFSGCGNDYTGPTTVSGGRLSVDCIRDGGEASDIGASDAAASNLVLTTEGVLRYTGDTVTTDRGFHLAGGWGGIEVVDGATTLEFTGNVTNASTGGLVKSGSGTLKLSGTNTYAGTVVQQGTLIAGSGQALGAGVLYIQNSGTVDMTGFSNTVAALSDNNTTGGEIRVADKTLTLSGGDATFAGRITGTTGSLIKNGGGTQTLTGCSNSYSGRTVVNSGAISVACLNDGGVNSSIGASSADASNLVIGSATAAAFHYVGTGGSTNRGFTMGGHAYIRNYGSGAINFTSTAGIAHTGAGVRQLHLGGNNTGTNILSAQIVNNGASSVSLHKDEGGTWRVTNQNSSFSGIVEINEGVLEVTTLANGNSNSSIGASGADAGNLRIGTDARLRYVGSGDSTNRLFTLGTGTTLIESSGTGAINFTDSGGLMGFTGTGARTFTLGGTYAGDNIMGVTIRDQSGTAQTSLAKNDAGTWILTANNTYTGNTVINDGKLIIGNGGTVGNVGTGEVILAFPSGVLGLNRSDTVNFAGRISGPGTVEQMGEGTTVLSATNSVGATRITEGTLQINGTLTTDTIAFSDDEATTLVVNGTLQGSGIPAAITGDASPNIINVNGGGTLTASGDLGGGADAVTLAGTLNTGTGVLGLGASNDTLTLNDGGTVVGGVTGGAGTDTLQVNNTAAMILQGGSFFGFESLNKTLGGTLTLTGNHTYSTGATIAAGTLQIGNGATAGALTTPTVANNGTLAFNLDSNYSFTGAISGTGAVNKLGTGVATLTGTNTYKGATNVSAGTLLVNGNQSAATGTTSVASGATLGGTGTIGGNVSVSDGGTLSAGAAGNAPGELTINGALTLNNTSNVNVNFGQAGSVGGSLNDLITVGGDLVLDGTLNVAQTPDGTFGPGVYRIFNYGGSLTDSGLAVTDPDYFVQTAVANQINLVSSEGLALSFWDGDAGPHSNSLVNGGTGTWRAAGDQNWTDSTGLFAAPFANASFAIFQGAAGTVAVDNANAPVQALGMQFATNGYVIGGDGIELVDDSTQAGLQSVIRVGDGTAAGAGYVATINSVLSGNTQLVKTDLGTLVLSGANSYTSGTAINGGTLQISADANLGAAGGALSLSGGRLRNTAAVTSTRTVTLNAAGGTLETIGALTLNGTVGGAGTLTKTGADTLVLTGTNTYGGGTLINDGTVEVSANANLGNAAGSLTFDGGTLNSVDSFTAARNVTLNAGGGTFDTLAATTLTLSNTVGGAGALMKAGAGTLVLTGTNNYGGGTTIGAGTLQLGNGGATGSIIGNVLNNGTFAFNRSASYTFAGSISGTGAVEQLGSGVTILTADNSYTGATNVREGTLIVNGDQSGATGLTTVEAGGVLGGTGRIGGDVDVLDGGALSPGNPGAIPGTLTINGNLSLAADAALNYNFGQAGVVGGAYNDLAVVHGDLVLDGAINVAETPGGNFGPGIYRIISYDGTLTDVGLSESSPDHLVQTAVAGQVNLVDISSMTLNFWDGDVGPKADDLVNGGNGTWRAAGDDNWSDDTGNINAAFSNGSFAVFAGAAGTVSVDNANGQVQASGMQFATDGYVISGDDVDLTGPQSILRVGDGTAAGAGYVATVTSVLTGDSELVKTDLGTLVLTGNNTYTGGTSIRQGTLQFSSDANLGDASGGLTLDNGTLRNTVTMSSARRVTLTAAGGTFETAADLTLSGVIGGPGGFTKTGSGALILSGNNAYAGSTTVSAGSLIVNGDQAAATGATAIGSGATLGGRGIVGGDVTIADGASLSPGNLDGTPGTLTIAGDLTLSGGSTLNFSFGEANVAGGALNDLTVVGGDLVLDGTLNVSETPGGTFGPGIYRIFNYSGTLTNNGLSLGTIPSAGSFVQTAIANQVNLVNTNGMTLNYWDGGAGPKFDGAIQGGDGLWQNSAGNDNWADGTGVVNAAFTDGSFAIFSGASGTVTVDDSLGQVIASGMQFAVDGYVIAGGPHRS